MVKNMWVGGFGNPLPGIKSGQKYGLVALDCSSKWVQAKAVCDHGALSGAKKFKSEHM